MNHGIELYMLKQNRAEAKQPMMKKSLEPKLNKNYFVGIYRPPDEKHKTTTTNSPAQYTAHSEILLV